jgi:hypothetical protein
MASTPFPGKTLTKHLNIIRMGITYLVILLVSNQLHAAPLTNDEFTIGTGVSGSWYTPGRSGEGWFIEALDEPRVLVYWFTYSGENTSQAWMVGTGTLTDNNLHIPELYTTSGPGFGDDYDPGDLSLEPWGELSIRFDSCDTAELSFQGPSDSDTRTINRLTGVPGTLCNVEANRLSGHSGSWFKPERDGEGWILQQFTEEDFLVAWFTYNSDGDQAWMTGVGRLDKGQLAFPDVLITHGTRFGPMFDPQNVVREIWGDIYFSFSDCGSGIVDYEAHIPPLGKARYTFEQLTKISGIDCDDTKPVTINHGSWEQRKMPTSRIGARSATIDGSIYLSGGFGQAKRLDRFDPETNQWQRLADLPGRGRTRHAVVAHEGALYVFGGINGGNWTTVGLTSVLRYSPELNLWEELPSLPTSLHTGASVSVGNSIYILPGHRAGFWRYDPTSHEYVALPDQGIRIGARLVLFKGEIWMIGGYNYTADFNQVKIFNTVDETWRDGPSLGDLRAGFAAHVLQGQIITIGGEVTINTQARLIEEVEILASAGTGWVLGQSPVFPVYDAASAVVGGRLYIFGGGDVSNTLNSTDHLQIFTPVAD